RAGGGRRVRPPAAAWRARGAGRDHTDQLLDAAHPLPHRRRRRAGPLRRGRRAVAASRAGHGARHRRVPHARRAPGVRRLLHAAVLRPRLGGPVPGGAGGLRQAAGPAGPAPRHRPRARGGREAGAGPSLPQRPGRGLRRGVRGRRRHPPQPHGQAAVHGVARGARGMTTESRAVLVGPRASPAAEALTTRLLGGTVAVYVAWTMVLGNVPGLSRVPHFAVVVAFVLLLIKSTQSPLKLRLDVAVPLGALFVGYACASVLWSFDPNAALVSAVSLAMDFAGAVIMW